MVRFLGLDNHDPRHPNARKSLSATTTCGQAPACPNSAIRDLLDNALATQSEDGMAAANLAQFFSRAARPFKPSGRSKGRRITLGAVMPCLRPADPLFYAEWADGRFSLAGTSIVLAERSPFAIERAPEPWRRALHGFDWLRHIPSTTDTNAAAHVQTLVAEWLALGRRRDAVATSTEVTARRVLSWLAHADVLLQTDDADHYDAVMHALQADIASLASTQRTTPAMPQDNAGQFLALIARAAAGICIDEDHDILSSAETALAAALSERQHLTRAAVLRSPPLIAELLLELESLRRLYRMQHRDVPEFLQAGLIRLRTTINGLLLGNGSLARLGNDRTSSDETLTLWLLARHAGITPAPAGYDARIGFANLAAGETRLVTDVGAPLAARDALAIEMSTGIACLIVKSGHPTDPGKNYGGTLVFAARNNGQQVAAPSTRHTPSLDPSHAVTAEFPPGAPQHIDATHAGLSQRGFAHRRRLTLSTDGRQLDGSDELRPLVGATDLEPTPFAVCFGLDPAVRVQIGDARESVTLTAGNGHRWRMAAPGHVISAESCVFQDGTAIRDTLQLLITSDTRANRTITWNLARLADALETSEINDTIVGETPPAEPPVDKPATLAEALAAATVDPPPATAVG
jgi:uncharacterized heparinase superfamily protein